MKKINILILVDKFDYHGSYINGPTRNYSRLLQNIDKDRFSAQLYSLRNRGQSDSIFRSENIMVNYLNLSKYNPLTFYTISRIILATKADILHLSGYGSTTFGRIAGIICRKPTIVHERWADPNLSVQHRFVEYLLSPFTTKAIAISDYARDYLITKKGIKNEKIEVIPNGIPLDEFRNANGNSREYMRGQIGVSDDVTVIGIVGMLHENKGHRYFIEAASLVRTRKPKTKFIIIGDGELRGQLESQVARLGLEDHVLFLGQQTDMPQVLNMLDIVVSCSISETGGTSLVEAMAAEQAIVTTDSGGPTEFIRDGSTGLVVPVKNSRAIAHGIEYLIDNPSVKTVLSKNARKASEKYDIRKTVQKIQELYEEVFLSA